MRSFTLPLPEGKTSGCSDGASRMAKMQQALTVGAALGQACSPARLPLVAGGLHVMLKGAQRPATPAD